MTDNIRRQGLGKIQQQEKCPPCHAIPGRGALHSAFYYRSLNALQQVKIVK